MNCNEARPLLEAYLDGELDLVHSLAIEQHVATCADCGRAREQHEALRAVLRFRLPRPPAPPELVDRLRATVRREAGGPSLKRWSWLAAAAVVTLALAVLSASTRWHSVSSDPLIAEAVANHVRSLLPGHLTDVLSSDRHTVKPWIAQHVDYSPPVVDLANEGFPLVGARLDYLANRTVATLVYRSREHQINVFVSPGTAVEAERWQTRDGFHVGTWSQAGMKYVVVSDLAEPELRKFSADLREPAK